MSLIELMMRAQAGLALRALYKGHLPEASFAIVTLVYTFVTLVGWRAAYATVIAGKVQPYMHCIIGMPFGCSMSSTLYD